MNKEHDKILRNVGQLKKKCNFRGDQEKKHAEFPWVLVFDLGISKGCHIILKHFWS